MLITPGYQDEQRKLHENPEYGVASVQYAPIVTQFINRLQVTELLDYGAGKCRLFENIKPDHAMRLQAYDPGVLKLAGDPVPSQMVACIDVLEHVEPHLLDNVLDDIKRLAQEFVFLTIHTGPAVKVLSDGRNAHLIQEGPAWWLPKIMDRWDMQTFQTTRGGFFVFGVAK